MPSAPTRREFLKNSALASSLLVAGCSTAGSSGGTGGGGTGVGAVAPATVASRRGGERVRVAAIGIGNRGTAVIKNLLDTELVDFTAAADVDLGAEHCAEARGILGDIPMYQDFRDMLAEQGDAFDAVAVSTPDFAHFPVAMACMAAGKHIYLEKPLAHSFEEVDLLIEQAERTGVVTQMGNQGHSGANYFQFKAWEEAGVIKDITRIDAYMNKERRWHGWNVDRFDPGSPVPATLDWDLWHVGHPPHPYSDRLHPGDWRSWYMYGNGAFGDWGPHILDTAHRFLDMGMPHRIEAVHRDQPSDFIFPQASSIRFHFPARGKHPACVINWYDGVENLPPLPPEEGENARRQECGKFIYSADGTVFKGGTHEATLRIIPRERMREMAPRLPRFPQKNSDHFENFVLACLGREETRSPFSVAGPLSQVFSLGVIAQRLGGTLDFDRETNRFVDHPIANALLRNPPPLPGWESCYRL